MSAYIAIGANLGRREHSVLAAARAVAETGAAEVCAISSLYETEAVGMREARPFVNAVMEVRALLSPSDLLIRLKTIENDLGRRGGHNRPREIDLDAPESSETLAYFKEVYGASWSYWHEERYQDRAGTEFNARIEARRMFAMKPRPPNGAHHP